MHSDFLCLISPHIRETADDETDFAIDLIKNAFDRPVGFKTVRIEVHTEGRDDRDSADFQRTVEKIHL